MPGPRLVSHEGEPTPTPWRNRITGTGEEAPDQLLANPTNWRIHPRGQQDAPHRIVQALFEQMEVLGANHVWLYASVEAEARGWAAAMSGELRVEVRKTGRGERASASLTQQSLRFLMINRTPRESLPARARSA